MTEIMQREIGKDEDTEGVIGDIIKVKPWSVDAIPLEVDLPTLLRRLKEKFSRKQLP